jgi:predicted metal-dependent peptidase
MKEFKRRDELESNKSIAAAEKALSSAKIKLLVNYPLFGEVVIRMVMKPTYSIPTTAVDQLMNFWYNPDWVNGLNKIDQLSSTAHEAGHVIQSIFTRTPKMVVPHIWNIAADHMVDTMNIDAGIEPGPWRQSKCPPEIQAAARTAKTTEVRYRQLLEEMENSPCPGCAAMASMAMKGELVECGGEGNSLEEKQEGSGEGQEEKQEIPEHTCGQEPCCCSASMMSNQKLSPQQQVEQTTKWQQIVAKAAITQKSKGDLPGQLEEFLASLSRPKVNWRDHIRVLATSVFPDRYTLYQRSRRSHAMGLFLPGRTKSSKGAIGVFDTSGSISDEELTAFLSEFVGLMEQCGCSKLEVIFHDSVIYYQGEHEKADLGKIKVQRGGTSHIPVFERLNDPKRKEKPAMVVCFTDLETCFPSEKPSYPVLWCCPEQCKEHSVPWGRKIPVDMETLRS